MKIINDKVYKLAVIATENDPKVKETYQALRTLNSGKLGANTIEKRIDRHFQKKLDLYVVGEQVPVNVLDLKNLLELTDNIPANSDQRNSIVIIHNLLKS